jgi:hypothetical protein
VFRLASLRLAALTVACVSFAAPAAAAPGDVWNAGSSFKAEPNQANPAPDTYGNANVWHYRQSATLAREPSQFAPLATFDGAFCGKDDLERWYGTLPYGGYPWIGRNTTGATVSNPCADGDDTEAWEAGPLMVHPGDTKLAVVEWHSPIMGNVSIAGSVKDLDPGCVGYDSDGVGWALDRAPSGRASNTPLASGSIANGSTQQQFKDGTITHSLDEVAVVPGDIIYVAIHPQGTADSGQTGTSPHCDTTALNLTITQAGTTAPPDETPPPDPAVRIVAPADGAAPYGNQTVEAAAFSGTSVPGAGDVTVVAAKRGVGTIALDVTQAPDGTWTAKPKQTLTQGVYDLGVAQTNAQNKTARAHRVFAVDLTRPVLTLTSPPFGSVHVFREDQLAIVKYAGELKPVAGDRPDTVAVKLRYWTGEKWAQREPQAATVNGTSWTAKSPSLRAGQYAAWASQDDAAGNHGLSTTPLPNGGTSEVTDFWVVRGVPATEQCVRESLKGLATTMQQIRTTADISTFGVPIQYLYVPPSAGTSVFANAAGGAATLKVKALLRKPRARRAVLIARATKRLRRAGLASFNAKPTRAAKKIKPHRRNKLIVVQTVTLPNGKTTSVRAVITKKRVAYASAESTCGGAPAPVMPEADMDQFAVAPSGRCVRWSPADARLCVEWDEPCPARLEGKGYKTYDAQLLFGTARHCVAVPPGAS